VPALQLNLSLVVSRGQAACGVHLMFVGHQCWTTLGIAYVHVVISAEQIGTHLITLATPAMLLCRLPLVMCPYGAKCCSIMRRAKESLQWLSGLPG
jgi:hypothetical protein